MRTADSETIVVGLDHSVCSQDALRWAVGEAARSHRPLLIVHVWHWTNDALASPTAWVGMPDTFKSGRRLLARALMEARADGVEASIRMIKGAPARQLLAVAADAAMLVVGSHGQGPLSKAILGSVSRDCVAHARCPVVVVPPASPASGPVGRVAPPGEKEEAPAPS